MTDTAATPAKVLVANRGEIALRIIRSLNETGRTSVAVYADQDMDSQFVCAADEAYALQGSSADETYLNGDKILDIARISGADAVHPGYGFLAENADFARKVLEAGLIWIGPRPEVINLLGDKIRARQTALSVGVSPVPGTQEPLTGRFEVEEFLAQWGYPVVLKAADGGGGRGIHVLRSDEDLDLFFAGRDLSQAKGASTAGSAFFIERYIQRARHIETQSGRDSHGTFTVYSTRDCSVQRRHQKMIEEAPAPFLPDGTEDKLFEASQALFTAVDYVGLGTCEFLLDEDGSLYFLEVNPRLQVEHTVTEEVAGVDLVAAQLAIAAGKDIPLGKEVRGHALELRVTSEDPGNDLAPTMGTLTRVQWPTGPGIRIDTGIGEGDAVSPNFDSMVAKVIVTAPTREQAIERALRVTRETVLEGVSNPLPLYAHILRRPEFARATNGNLGVWTRWLEDGVLEEFSEEYSQEIAPFAPPPSSHGAVPAPTERTRVIIELDGKRAELTLPASLLAPPAAPAGPKRVPQPLRSAREQAKKGAARSASSDSVVSPIQAIVVRIPVSAEDTVAEGDVVVVLESMKMESYVRAPRAGVIETISVEVGTNVSPDQILATLMREGGTP